MSLEKQDPLINEETVDKIKSELYNLIRRYCKAYNISRTHYELWLHDSTNIEFDMMRVSEVERFISLIIDYQEYFRNLISNLSFESVLRNIESSDRVVGVINIEKTRLLRNNQGTNNIVCSVYSNNLFIPENILLGSVLLGINLLASKFLKEGKDQLIEEFKMEVHGKFLQLIIQYSGFLLKDRFITKIVDYYILHYDDINQVFNQISTRINSGNINEKYKPLLKFIQEWKNFQWILSESKNSLRRALTPYFDSIDYDKLYEMWIFFKILHLFEPLKQKSHGKFVNSDTGIEIEYQHTKKIGWVLEKPNSTHNLLRFPDIVVKKKGKIVAIIDAKYMKYSEQLEGEQMEPAPDRNIVHQMLVYLDYGIPCDLGIVLFADEKIRDDILIREENTSRRIVFLNCFPYSESATLALDKVKNYLSS